MGTSKHWWAIDLPTWLLLAGEAVLVEQIREGGMMAVDPELLELYVDDVWIEPYVSTDFDNVDTFGASVKYAAKIDAKTEEVLRKTGDVAVATHSIALDNVYSVDEKDRVTMPARFLISKPEIMAVKEWTDELGPHHTTLKIGARKGARA